ncbi:hypothetical protein OSB04_028975 [Centaurea solstitialis]|uniref:Uncharacterized protein n=1 Tax=Centaurea solstitialis TaxID=347529 RepID=A0AA38SID9_9ASTR|nr:hypothetical protein OSB04_028975 [Centaurea solstitialis]
MMDCMTMITLIPTTNSQKSLSTIPLTNPPPIPLAIHLTASLKGTGHEVTTHCKRILYMVPHNFVDRDWSCGDNTKQENPVADLETGLQALSTDEDVMIVRQYIDGNTIIEVYTEKVEHHTSRCVPPEHIRTEGVM